MAVNFVPEPEYTDAQQHESVLVWREILERLLDHSGMWFTGDGGSSGPKPKLASKPASNKSHNEDE